MRLFSVALLALALTNCIATRQPCTVAAPSSFVTALPQFNFNFPTSKFTQASANFQAASSQPAVSGAFNNFNTFNGFSTSFKADMASLIAKINSLNTIQGKMITDKLTIDLISIDNSLNLISANSSRQAELRPVLAFQVQQLLNDVTMVQSKLGINVQPIISGDNNVLAGSVGLINGDNNMAMGQGNVVIGNNNALVGNSAVISGDSNAVIGNSGITVGNNNLVKGSNSFVFSNNDLVTQDNSLVVGNYTLDLGKMTLPGNIRTANSY